MRLLPTLLLAWTFAGISIILADNNREPVQIVLDYAQFSYDENLVYLEIYYSTGEDQLTYVDREGQFVGAILLWVVVIAQKNDSILVDRVWRTPHVGDPDLLDPDRKVVGMIGLTIPPGKHKLRIKYYDEMDRSRVDSISFDLPERTFLERGPAISDLELCVSIEKASPDPGNIFYKNTYNAIPNPSKLYGLGKPLLFYYAECYGLTADENNGLYQLLVTVSDRSEREVYRRSYERVKQVGSRVEVGTVNVSAMPSGRYNLVLTMVDSSIGLTVSTQKRFFVYNPDLVAAEESISPYVEILYGELTEEQLNEEFAKAWYTASKSEIKGFKQLSSSAAKRIFLHSFWRRRDQTSATPISAFREEYFRRVDLATAKYSSGARKGWKTDRGRVLILYGNPDEIELHPNEIASKPYEIWYYHNLQGGVYFIFVDRTGFLDYYLVQSSARNEINDPTWQSR